MNTTEIINYQKEKLKTLLLECVKNVPAYKTYSHLINEIESDSSSAIKKFKILDKAYYLKNSNDYLNKLVSKSSLILNYTGGSTGEPFRFYMDRHTVDYYEAARWRGLSWREITPGSRSIMLWGNPIELSQINQKKYKLKEKWLKNRILMSAYSLKPESMKDYLKKVNNFKPEYFYGYASALHTFSVLMISQNLKMSFNPKVIVSTAETLHEFQKETIEKAFNCPVINEYGARDAGILAYQCTHGSMHITSENVFLEVVHPKTFQPVPPGKSGILLVTDLNNLSAPRLRYKLGDRIVLSNRTCKCGMGLPIMEKIDGREDDMFVTVDGSFVHGHAFNQIARKLNAVKKFQIIQNSPSKVNISIIPNENFENEEIERFICDIKQLLPKTEVNFKLVESIPVTNSGKFRYAIRKFQI
jgi:phenylacetate-CoA ligase